MYFELLDLQNFTFLWKFSQKLFKVYMEVVNLLFISVDLERTIRVIISGVKEV